MSDGWNAFEEGKPENVEHTLGKPLAQVWWVDEEFSKPIDNVPLGVDVHYMRATDHRPGCWSITESGSYAVTAEPSAVTCEICYAITHAGNPPFSTSEELKT